MANKFIDLTGLEHVWSKIKTLLSGKADNDLSNVNASSGRANLGLNDAITGLSVSGKTITYTQADGGTGTITTQDTNTTYSNMTGASSSAAGKAGLVPAPAAGKQASFLRGDGTWATPTNTTYSAMTGATSSAAGKAGLVPAPAAGKQTSFLCGDGTWQTPANTTYSVATTSANGLMSSTDKSKLDGIASGANKYSHPSYTAKSSGFYKVTVDSTGHVSATTAVAKSDITGLGIPAQDTTYSAATTSAAGLMSAADKSKLDGIASGANNYTYTLPTASSSTLGGVKTTSTVTSTSGLTACPIISGVPYYKDTNNTYTLSSFGVNASASELNVLDGITATTAELNYCDGVTSNIQTQLNGKLSTSGTAAKATADASGNNIANTYAKKTELGSYLPLSGGTVTGDITINKDDGAIIKSANTGRMIVRGATTNDDGASLYLTGKSFTSDPCAFSLLVDNGTTNAELHGNADGVLTWENLVFSTGNIKKSDTTGGMNICSGTAYNDSPALSMYPKDYSDTALAGRFVLRAGENAYQLVGTKDGNLTWGGKSLLGGSSKSAYATSSTAATTTAKVATITNSVPFTLEVGATVVIKFSNGLSGQWGNGSKDSLNVNSTGAKPTKAYTTQVSGAASVPNNTYMFIYDGTYWNMLTFYNYQNYDE